MALRYGSKKSILCDQGVKPASRNNGVEAGGQASATPTRKNGSIKCLLAFLIITIIILAATGATRAWYFLEHRVWLLEPCVQQQYTAYLSILNRNFSADLSSDNSPAFKKEAKGVENMVNRDSCDTDVH